MKENQNKISNEYLLSVCHSITGDCEINENIRNNINEIINIKHPNCKFKIGRTDNLSERLLNYKDDINVMYPIVFCNNIDLIIVMEEILIKLYQNKYPNRCKNKQEGGGQNSNKPHQYVYIVIY